MVTAIPLTKGKVALVDDEDVPLVSGYAWYARQWEGRWYVNASFGGRKNRTRISMHRLIMGFPKGQLVDHANGDGLDNQRCNLRVATNAQNVANQKKRPGTRFPYKGIGVHDKQPIYRAVIWSQRRSYRSRWFRSVIEAAQAYDELARQHHGAFARLNFPMPGERKA
jgi:hypothetical protein